MCSVGRSWRVGVDTSQWALGCKFAFLRILCITLAFEAQALHHQKILFPAICRGGGSGWHKASVLDQVRCRGGEGRIKPKGRLAPIQRFVDLERCVSDAEAGICGWSLRHVSIAPHHNGLRPSDTIGTASWPARGPRPRLRSAWHGFTVRDVAVPHLHGAVAGEPSKPAAASHTPPDSR